MTATSISGSSLGFGFGTAFSVALQSVFGHFRRFLKLAIVPFLLALIFSVAKVPAAFISLPVSELVFGILDLVPFTFIGIAISRVILVHEDAGYLPQPVFGHRTWVYLGYSLLMMVGLTLAIAVLAVIGFGAAALTENSDQQFNLGFWPVLFLVGAGLLLLYVMIRLSLVFPAIAADQKLGLRGSWRLARGNGLKLFGLFIVLCIVMLFLAAIGSLVLGTDISVNIGGGIEILPGASVGDTLSANATSIVWGNLVSIAGAALMTAAFASAYAQLSGWGGPREEILERFE